jgi:hypothetical protein
MTNTPTTNKGTNHNENERGPAKPLSNSSFIRPAIAGSVAAVKTIPARAIKMRLLCGMSKRMIRLNVWEGLIKIGEDFFVLFCND